MPHGQLQAQRKRQERQGAAAWILCSNILAWILCSNMDNYKLNENVKEGKELLRGFGIECVLLL